VKFINNFEQTCADIGISNQYDYVICGHIHQPEMRRIENEQGAITYLNSGDWIENLSALEYADGKWSIYRHADQHAQDDLMSKAEEETEPSVNEIFASLLAEFQMLKQ
jgi:hypothetical protein